MQNGYWAGTSKIEFQWIFKIIKFIQVEQAVRFGLVRRRVIFNKQAQSVALKAVQNLDFNQPPIGGVSAMNFF
ncbi:hypothetical protein RM11_0237 [Bartonella quintana RM-11]|nr:hypothetical protein RM11_0237 [Bartonella quintana RM-11]